eukprot:scaffold4392_cov138-Skeletonema_marinoi.AAC.21
MHHKNPTNKQQPAASGPDPCYRSSDMCVRVSLRKRCASFIALTLFLALKLSLAFPIITSSSVGRHHKLLDEIKLYLQSNNDVNLSIQDENIAQEIHKNRHNIAPINRILSSIVAISVFAFHDPSLAMSNDSIQTSFLNTRQVSAVSFISPKTTPTVYYSFTGVDTTATPSVKDVISEENKRIAEQMKEVDDRDSRSTLMYVIEEEDERITQQMQEVGITTRIDSGGSGAVTVNDVREETQRKMKMQQNSKSVPASSSNDRTTQQLSKQQLKGAGITSAPKPDIQQKAKSNTRAATLQKTASKELQTSDIKKIAAENKIEVELKDTKASTAVIKIDRETFTKVKVVQPPFLRYLPSSVQPLISSQFKSVQVLKSIPDDQLFIASVVAGSLTEVIRTTLLYPLSTVKARVQARSLRSANRKRKVLRKLKVTWLTFLYETKKGGLYAGLIPSLLITVPASGVYAGTKEVSRRAFTMAIPFIQNVLPHDETASTTVYSALVVSLLAAFVADITALALRTPADVLSLRLQVFGDTNVNSDLSSWLKDSIALLPAMIVTDIPYLLSRIFLNAAILTSGENLGTYEVETIAVACICAFLTTPFDVARTRILLPTLPSEVESNEYAQKRRLVAPSKYREQRRQKVSVPLTMKRIVAEGNGVQNLYTGWLERTVFLGLGRAWLDPLRIIGYLGLRDAILLKFFD